MGDVCVRSGRMKGYLAHAVTIYNDIRAGRWGDCKVKPLCSQTWISTGQPYPLDMWRIDESNIHVDSADGDLSPCVPARGMLRTLHTGTTCCMLDAQGHGVAEIS